MLTSQSIASTVLLTLFQTS